MAFYLAHKPNIMCAALYYFLLFLSVIYVKTHFIEEQLFLKRNKDCKPYLNAQPKTNGHESFRIDLFLEIISFNIHGL